MTLQEEKDLFHYTQNHLVLGLSLWPNTNLQHQTSTADTPHFDQMPTSFYFLILQEKKKSPNSDPEMQSCFLYQYGFETKLLLCA